MITINGIAVPAPDSYEITISDLDASANRSGNGTLYRDRIATKRTLNLSWAMMDHQDLSSLLNAVSPVFFPVTYTDPALNGLTTKTFYVSDRNAGIALKMPDGTYRWSGVSFSLVER